MRKRISLKRLGVAVVTLGLLTVLFYVGLNAPDGAEENAPMVVEATAEETTAISESIPPIDAQAPVETETATFAMG